MTQRTISNWRGVLLLLAMLARPARAQVAPPSTRPSTTRPATTRVASATATTRPAPPRVLPPIGRPSTLPAALLRDALTSTEDLRALQKQVRDVVAKVSPAVVGLRIGGGQGSGVIVTEDGFVLTAAHVCGAPNRPVAVLLADGRQVSGLTRGTNNDLDAGVIQITEPGPLPGGKWPAAAIGSSAGLRAGQWCLAMGHPGGYRTGRTAPLRLGRVLDVRANALRTDCTLVGGDSGGPLFDLWGRVIGIHSRIGTTVSDNVHVPVDAFRNGWTRLAAGEQWGEPFWLGGRRRTPAYLGIEHAASDTECRITQVYPGSPARRAGFQAGDVIERFDGSTIKKPGNLQAMLELRKSGDALDVIVRRGDQRVTLKVTLGKRPEEE